jgi:hypothetical protein
MRFSFRISAKKIRTADHLVAQGDPEEIVVLWLPARGKLSGTHLIDRGMWPITLMQ